MKDQEQRASLEQKGNRHPLVHTTISVNLTYVSILHEFDQSEVFDKMPRRTMIQCAFAETCERFQCACNAVDEVVKVYAGLRKKHHDRADALNIWEFSSFGAYCFLGHFYPSFWGLLLLLLGLVDVAAFLDLFALWFVAATFLDPFSLLLGAVCLGEGLGFGFAVLQLSSGVFASQLVRLFVDESGFLNSKCGKIYFCNLDHGVQKHHPAPTMCPTWEFGQAMEECSRVIVIATDNRSNMS
ncbi:hypothetical protein LXL04_023178 [Taraxacum kok-saghyz]